jgi:amino acid transporter
LRARRFGSFGGVFTPNVLTILGVVLFLRAGWVVGSAGLLGAILIIVISHLISFSTGLSLSAIATSMDVKAGGNYYMISRTLGLEVGGSIGLPLYLSQALSVAFYIIGFTEGLHWVFPWFDPIITASIACIILSIIAIIGADLAVRVQYFILAVLGLSLVSFFSGRTGSPHPIALWGTGGVGFWSVFAIFFPAVTGIEVGVSMSGDLKDPQRNIPRGTLLAIGVTFLIYLAQAGWLALNVPGEELSRNLMVMKTVARWPGLIVAGLWAATISSALGCIIAAPRTLQALAHDRILPEFIAKGSRQTNEPRIATLITFIIAEGCILMGGLDAVAPVITMFFLNTYGVINLIAALENLVGNPSYRPKFRVPWLISLGGAIGCYLTMFLIHGPATVMAILIAFGIYIYLGRKDLHATWGDVRSGLWYSLARFAILKLEDAEWHPLNWRPNVMVFSGNPHTRKQLVGFANWLGKGKGIIALYQLLLGIEDKAGHRRRAALRLLKNFIRENKLHILGQVYVAENFRQGTKQVVQTHGLGRMQSNLVLLGWCGDPSREAEFAGLIRDLHHLQKSVLVLNIAGENGFGKRRRIDVWWGGMQQNGNLMILIAYLISQNPEWQGCTITLNMIIKNEQGRQAATTNLKNILRQAHIEARVNIIVPESPRVKMPYIIRKHSQHADLVILGMRLPEEGKEEEFMQRMALFLAGLPTTLLVKSVEDIKLIT